MNATKEKIGELAERVGREHRQYTEAIETERQARAQTIAAVVALVRPALRAISSRVAIAATMSKAGTTTEPAPWRGLHLVGPGPTRMPGGSFGGHNLYLDHEGQLVELRYSGNWLGDVQTWRAEVVTASPATVAEDYETDVVLQALADALLAQVDGDKVRNTRSIAERARQIAAVASMIRGTV